MKRIQAFEFEDMEWLPSGIRNNVTELIQHLLTSSSIYSPIFPLLKEAAHRSNRNEIHDLCSGSGGPALQVQEFLGDDYRVILSDRYPNLEKFRRIKDGSGGSVDYIETPIDATRAPAPKNGFRTLFSSFHHFPPDQARSIILDAVEKNIPIGVFEFTERKVSNFLKIFFFGTLLVWIQTLLIKPRRAERFFWTYLLPVVPLVYCWDAIISHWRTYTLEELEGMLASLPENSFDWEVGQKPTSSGFMLTFLIGTPSQPSTSAD